MLRSVLVNVVNTIPMTIISNPTIKELYGYFEPELDENTTLSAIRNRVFERTGEIMNSNDTAFAQDLLQQRFQAWLFKNR